VSTWKRRAVDGLGEVFSNGVDGAIRDHEAEVRDLHARIGELTVVNDISQRRRKRIEEIFGWVKVQGGQAKTRFRGHQRVEAWFTLALRDCPIFCVSVN